MRRGDGGASGAHAWVPVMLGLGLPLSPDKLCIAVCGRAGASNFLEVGLRSFLHVHFAGWRYEQRPWLQLSLGRPKQRKVGRAERSEIRRNASPSTHSAMSAHHHIQQWAHAGVVPAPLHMHEGCSTWRSGCIL